MIPVNRVYTANRRRSVAFRFVSLSVLVLASGCQPNANRAITGDAQAPDSGLIGSDNGGLDAGDAGDSSLDAGDVGNDAGGDDPDRHVTKRLKVLFIGNSLTFVNDIPGKLSALAQSTSSTRIEVDQLTIGGATLELFLDGSHRDATIAKIKSNAWDFVVIQQQSASQWQFMNYDDAVPPDAGPNWDAIAPPPPGYSSPWCQSSVLAYEQIYANQDSYVCLYDRLIRAQGARPVIYMHWVVNLDDDLGIITGGAFLVGAQKIGAMLSPVGLAVQSMIGQPFGDTGKVFNRICANEDCLLSDNVHPQPLTAYLAAAVFYATLTGQSPVGLSPLGFDKTVTEQLQHAAWASYQTINQNTGLLVHDVVIQPNGTTPATIDRTAQFPRCLSLDSLGSVGSCYFTGQQSATGFPFGKIKACLYSILDDAADAGISGDAAAGLLSDICYSNTLP